MRRYDKPDRLIISGEPISRYQLRRAGYRRRRSSRTHLIIVNDTKIPIRATGFRILAALAVARHQVINVAHGAVEHKFGQGWVTLDDLYYDTSLVSYYLYRTKQMIHGWAPGTGGWPIYEYHKSGAYRLIADPDNIIIDWDRLRGFQDAALTELVKNAS